MCKCVISYKIEKVLHQICGVSYVYMDSPVVKFNK